MQILLIISFITCTILALIMSVHLAMAALMGASLIAMGLAFASFVGAMVSTWFFDI
jgi:hypothetical protein